MGSSNSAFRHRPTPPSAPSCAVHCLGLTYRNCLSGRSTEVLDRLAMDVFQIPRILNPQPSPVLALMAQTQC